MSRVLIETQAWGWYADRFGNGIANKVLTINGPVYTTKTGSTVISSITTNSNGVIPGWIEVGEYSLLIDGVTREVDAVSGTVESSVAAITPTVIEAGNLTGTYNLDVTGLKDVLVRGTLTGNLTITVANETAGCRYSFELTQDSTGGRTVTFPVAVQPAGTLGVNSTALVTSLVSFYSPDGASRVGWSSVLGTLDLLTTKRIASATGTGAATASGSTITVSSPVQVPGTLTPNDFIGAFRLTMKSSGMATGRLTTITRAAAAGHAGLVFIQPLSLTAVAAQITTTAFSNGQTFDVTANVAPVASSVIDLAYLYVE